MLPLLDTTPATGLDDARRRLEKAGARVVAICDAEYPALLRESPDPPPVLFVRGRPLGDAPVVALVGSRRATRAGLEAARLVAAGLARAGVIVVSGFAHGIDAAAHAAALEEGGETWGVLGCGVDVSYPAAHERLRARMLEGGALLSELPPGTTPEPWHFPVRNRIIAGCARVVVVVEAALEERLAHHGAVRGRGGPRRRGRPRPRDRRARRRVERPPEGRGDPRPRRGRRPRASSPTRTSAAFARAGSPDQGARRAPPDDPDAARVLLALDAAEPRDADALAAATGLSGGAPVGRPRPPRAGGARRGPSGGPFRQEEGPGLTTVAS